MAGPQRPNQVRFRPPAPRGTETSKVPEVNIYFWAVKILTTAMGEAVSDFLVRHYNPYLAVFAGFVVFAIAITWQFRVSGYRTWPYWTAVAMVAVFGTMVADAMHVGMGIPYKVSVGLFGVSLAIIFAIWYRVEGTLSIHSILTPRREFFYWATVCCTFALGTATGDLTATTLHLGYFTSGVVFTLAILLPLVAWRLGVNPVLTFWVAYILTRPIGASFADFFGMPKTSGGLGIGHGPVSLVTTAAVVASIAYLAKTGKDQSSPAADAGLGARYGAGYGPEPGYGPQPGYGPPGYGPQPGYGRPPAYGAQPGYDGPPGHGGQPGHQPRPQFQPRPGAGQQPGQPPRPGYGPTFTPAPGYQPGHGPGPGSARPPGKRPPASGSLSSVSGLQPRRGGVPKQVSGVGCKLRRRERSAVAGDDDRGLQRQQPGTGAL
jgi:uncharacterized membrane-anchored protein